MSTPAGWGRTKGYIIVATKSFPRVTGGRYRLDTILSWEEGFLHGVLTIVDADAAASRTTP